MTHPIPAGTCNVAVNMTAEARSILGRLAFQSDLSLGAFIRRALLRALEREHPTEAQLVARAERRRRALGAAMLAVGLLAVGREMFLGDDTLRRPPGIRVYRTMRGKEAV